MRGARLLWAPVAALLVLTARWLCYALAPSPLAGRLESSTGGPRLVVVTLVSLALAAAVSAAALWLAIVGVRERQRLRPERELPRLRLRRLALRAGTLFVSAALGFAALESWLHWRAGLGFHGLSCLAGPVHRNALPVLAALTLVAAALAEVMQHVHAWARATVAELLRPRLRVIASRPDRSTALPRLSPALARVRARPRAPPLPA